MKRIDFTQKKASSEWTLQTVVTLILVVILLVLIVVGLVTGKINPLLETIDAKIDGVLILFGFQEDISIQEDACVSYPTVVSVPRSNDEEVIFTQCKDYNSHRCELHTFSDGSEYYYFPGEQRLRVKRNDSEAYDVSFTEDDSHVALEDQIYYASIAKLYEAYGVSDGGRREQYTIRNYLVSGMDDDFGTFGDLLVIGDAEVGEGNRHVYLMVANGLYAVVDVRKVSESDLWFFQKWFVNEEDIATVNPELITPLLTADEKWVLYSGRSERDAISAFNSVFSLEGQSSFVSLFSYTICPLRDHNSLYRNCLYANPQEGKPLYDLILSVYDAEPDLFSFPETYLTLSESMPYLSRYLQNDRNVVFTGQNVDVNVARINEKLLSVGNSITVDGKEYTLRAHENTVDTNEYYFPQVGVYDGEELLYDLAFNGIARYLDNDREFFLNDGNAVQTPFGLYEPGSEIEIDVSREFSQSDFENALDRSVLDFFVKRC